MQSRFINCAAKWSLCCTYAAVCGCIMIFSYNSHFKLFWSTNMIYCNNLFRFICIFNGFEKMSIFLEVCCKYAAICSKPLSFAESTIFFLFSHAKIPPYTNFHRLINFCSEVWKGGLNSPNYWETKVKCLSQLKPGVPIHPFIWSEFQSTISPTPIFWELC